MKRLMLIFVMSIFGVLSYADDGKPNDIAIEGLDFKDMKITTDEKFRYIELKHTDGTKTYKVSEFPVLNIGMKDGTVIEKAKLSEINPSGITVMFAKGVKTLKFEDMNESYQSFFSYDDKAEDAYLAKIDKSRKGVNGCKGISGSTGNIQGNSDRTTSNSEVQKQKDSFDKMVAKVASDAKIPEGQKIVDCPTCRKQGWIMKYPRYWEKNVKNTDKPTQVTCPGCHGKKQITWDEYCAIVNPNKK